MKTAADSTQLRHLNSSRIDRIDITSKINNCPCPETAKAGGLKSDETYKRKVFLVKGLPPAVFLNPNFKLRTSPKLRTLRRSAGNDEAQMCGEEPGASGFRDLVFLDIELRVQNKGSLSEQLRP